MTVLETSFPPRAHATPSAAAPQPLAPEMTGQNIICFAKDFDEDPTSNHHIMRLLSAKNRVLWLNSIATRTPNLASTRDLGKIFRKLKSFFKGPRKISDSFWVYTPIVIPIPGSRIATAFNTWLLRAMLRFTRRRLGMKRFQLWVFIPTAAKYAGKLGESLLVYYVTDEYSKFGYVNTEQVAADDRQLTQTADIIFGTAQSLVDKRRPANANTFLARHGVDYSVFSCALDPATPVPADIAALQKPLLGFYGSLQHWIDYDLIEFLSRRHPEWSIALIGQPFVDLSRFAGIPNVHLLGRKPHATLPAYCKAMTVGLIPHKVCELTLNMNPIKLREYLCAGLPVVSVDLPEVRACADGEDCRVATSYEEFEKAVAAAIAADSPESRRRRSQSMQKESWEQRVADIGRHVIAAAQTHAWPTSGDQR